MAFSRLQTRTLVIACFGLLAGSAFGYWGYDEYRKFEARSGIVAVIGDTSERLRDALQGEIAITPASHPAVLRRYYDHAEAVDAHLHRLRDAEGAPTGELARAADDYLLTAREILLRRASSQRSRLELAGSAHALRVHMRADDRTGAWVRAAVRAKERVEEDYRDYWIAASALGSLLDALPDARTNMAAHVDAGMLVDDALIAAASDRTKEAARQTSQEVEQISRLAAYR